jgi:hypothetical protein
VGIGTNAPTNPLSVVGNTDFTSNRGIGTNTPAEELTIVRPYPQNDAKISVRWDPFFHAQLSAYSVGSVSDSSFSLITNSTSRLLIGGDGKISVANSTLGNVSPDPLFSIVSNNRSSLSIANNSSGTGNYGIYIQSESPSGYGIYSVSYSPTGTGVFGSGGGSNGSGLKGNGYNGVVAESGFYNGNGLYGYAINSPAAYGVWGYSPSGYAGVFSGQVLVTGNLSKGGGSFKLDHPLDRQTSTCTIPSLKART